MPLYLTPAFLEPCVLLMDAASQATSLSCFLLPIMQVWLALVSLPALRYTVEAAAQRLTTPISLQILRAGLEEMISSVQMFPSTLKLDLFVTAFGVLAPEGQLIRTGGHMHTSRSAVAMSGEPSASLLLPAADCEPGST